MRHLGLAERLFYLYGQRTNVNFSLVAELEGTIDADAITAAFSQVVWRHPLLRVGVGSGPTGQLAFLGGGPVPRIECHRATCSEWAGFVTKDLKRPLGKEGYPFFHVTVLLEDAAAAVILTFHHVVANGGSAVTVMTDLLSALTGRTLAQTAVPASLEGYAGYEAELSDYDRTIEPRSGANASAPSEAPADTRISTLAIGRGETETLLEASRRNGATLHGTMCAALAAVRARRGTKDDINVFSAVDLRDAIGAPHYVCAFLNGAMLTRVAIAKDFWEAARSVAAAAMAYREPAAVGEALQGLAAGLPAGATAADAVAILEGPLAADVEVTNLGAQTIALNYGDLSITGMWGPIPSPKTEGAPIVGIIGFGGELRIVQTYRGDTGGLLDELRAFLGSEVLDGSPEGIG